MQHATLVDAVEALVDPLAPDEAEECAALADFLARHLPEGRGEALEAAGEFPDGELRAFAREGFIEALVPVRAGGRLDWARAMRLATRLAAHDLDVTLCLGGTVLGATPLLVAGTDAQLADYFDPVRRGEMGGLALTEWAHGSDLLAGEARAAPLDERGEPAPLDRATHFSLTGVKSPTNNGTRGARVVVLARTSDDDGAFTHSLFVVPREATGLGAVEPFRPMGFRNMDLSGVRLEGVVLPASAVIGRPGEGFAHTRQALSISRSGVAHMASGASLGVAALAIEHAHARRLYGAPVASLGGAGALLAEITGRAVTAHALARVASRATARFGPEARAWTSAAKLVCPACFEENVHDAGTILGGRSLFVGEPLPRVRRAAPVLAIFDGSSQLQLDELFRYAAAWGEADGALVTDAARALFDAAPVRFDAAATDAGGLLAAIAPPSALAALGERASPLVRAAERIREHAGGARRAAQETKFAISRGAGELYALSALALCRLASDRADAHALLDASLDHATARAAPPLARSLVELAGPEPSPEVLDLARDLVALAVRGPAAREALARGARSLREARSGRP